MINPVIVVIAYNRPMSLNRILRSLSKAKYDNYNVKLIISIDKGDNENVLAIANEFKWEFGEKEVIYQNNSLKLRNHVLKCGELSKKYGSIIMLEDDLYVSPSFYRYATRALEFSMGKDYIAGISLYNHQFNVHVQENFCVMEDEYDNWYFQFASSWGQAWTYTQWSEFINWYQKNSNKNLSDINMPIGVSNWPDSSWLKYFIKYVIEKNKYFIYPRVSLTTNFSDSGTHNVNNSTVYQVPIQLFGKKEYKFSEFKQSNSIYDAFFENEKLYSYLGLNKDDLCVDLYAYRQDTSKRYYLSSRICNYKVIKSFGCFLKPHEANIIDNIIGHDIFLYDTSIYEKNRYRKDDIRRIEYFLKTVNKEKFFTIFKKLVVEEVRIYKYRIEKLLKLVKDRNLTSYIKKRIQH